MSDKKISELNSALSVGDSDKLALVQAAETKQLAASVLKSYMATAPTISGGTINNAVIGGTTAAAGTFTNLAYTGTLIGGSGVINIGSGQIYKDASGTLGLGGIPSSWALASSGIVQIRSCSIYGITATELGFVQNAYYNAGWKYISTDYAAIYTIKQGKHAWFNAPSGTAGSAFTFTQAMTLDASGNLGIGTTSPNARISAFVSGMTNQIVIGPYSYSTTYGAISFSGSTSIDSIIGMSGGGGTDKSLYLLSPQLIGLYVNSVERARVDSSGNFLITSTGGLGYGTGSGGAVTQATSRTTGVTLNKPNGAITLVSAAGSATYQSFTVTNSTVAASDVIQICQKSGTDKYIIIVTAVAAGSFQITFATTGGTTTEQPVFNFAVIKAVTA